MTANRCADATWRGCQWCHGVNPWLQKQVRIRLEALGVEPPDLATGDAQREQWEHRARAVALAVSPHKDPAWPEGDARRVDFFAGLRWAGVPFEMALAAIGPAVTAHGSAGWRSAFGVFDLANRWQRYGSAFPCPLELAETLIASDVYSRGVAMVRETFVQDYLENRAQPFQWQPGGTLRSPPGHKDALKGAGMLKLGDAPDLDMVSVGELIGLEMARHDLHPEDRIRERNAAYRVQVSNRGTNAWRTRGWPTAGDPWDRREAWRWVRRAPHPHEHVELCRWVYERSQGAGPSLPAREPERIYRHDPHAIGRSIDHVATETMWPARMLLPDVPESCLRESFEGGRPASRIQHVRGVGRVEVQVGIQDQSGEDVEIWSR